MSIKNKGQKPAAWLLTGLPARVLEGGIMQTQVLFEKTAESK